MYESEDSEAANDDDDEVQAEERPSDDVVLVDSDEDESVDDDDEVINRFLWSLLLFNFLHSILDNLLKKISRWGSYSNNWNLKCYHLK